MTDITGAIEKHLTEEVIYLSSQGERLLVKIGSNINALIDFYGDVALIGEIKQSCLSESIFQSRRGDGWVLMKGQDITGSDYANLTGITEIPNISGQFPRIHDLTATRDPDGATRSIFSIQDEQIKTHNHTITREQSSSRLPLKDNPTRTIMWNAQSSAHVGFYGGSSGDQFGRTSTNGSNGVPEYVNVNYFIRINV